MVKFYVCLGQNSLPPYKFKITRLVKKWTMWNTFDPKFPGFFGTSLGPSEGSRRANWAVVTPIGQQNQP